MSRDVAYWHLTDIPACPLSGRYWGQNARGADMSKSARMTRRTSGFQYEVECSIFDFAVSF